MRLRIVQKTFIWLNSGLGLALTVLCIFYLSRQPRLFSQLEDPLFTKNGNSTNDLNDQLENSNGAIKRFMDAIVGNFNNTQGNYDDKNKIGLKPSPQDTQLDRKDSFRKSVANEQHNGSHLDNSATKVRSGSENEKSKTVASSRTFPEADMRHPLDSGGDDSGTLNLRYISDPGLTPALQLPAETSGGKNCRQIPRDLHVPPVPLQDCKQPHVLMNDGGRLGNQVCQYISLQLLRHLFGIRVSITKRMQVTLSKIFKNISLPVHDPACFTKKTKRIMYDKLYEMLRVAASEAAGRTDRGMEPLLNTSYYVYHNPCPRDLILAHRHLLYSMLVFREEMLEQARNNIDQALKHLNETYRREDLTLITVHVRRTDYTSYIKKHYNLTQLSQKYFQRAFDFYRKRAHLCHITLGNLWWIIIP